MKRLFLIISVLVSTSIFAKEDCSLKGVDLDETSNIAERLFYTGTCHYRNEDYALAAKAWKELSYLKNVESEYQYLQIDVLNNLGYLMFFGYGVPKEQNKALSFWKKAITLGHYESEYHLCHAYADKKQPSYNLFKARKHCEKALLIYNGMEKKDVEILNILKKYNSQVNG